VMGDANPALAPGQRLPDTIEVRLATGERCGLHELTHRAGHTALLIAGSSLHDDELARLAESMPARNDAAFIEATIVLTTQDGHRHAWAWLAPSAAAELGIRDLSLLVVRPDGHIGLRADRDHLAGLAQYRSLLTSV